MEIKQGTVFRFYKTPSGVLHAIVDGGASWTVKGGGEIVFRNGDEHGTFIVGSIIKEQGPAICCDPPFVQIPEGASRSLFYGPWAADFQLPKERLRNWAEKYCKSHATIFTGEYNLDTIIDTMMRFIDVGYQIPEAEARAIITEIVKSNH